MSSGDSWITSSSTSRRGRAIPSWEYQVRSLPTLIIENDDGIVERFVGVTQAEDIEAAFDQAGA